jgi:hypothetical protein
MTKKLFTPLPTTLSMLAGGVRGAGALNRAAPRCCRHRRRDNVARIRASPPIMNRRAQAVLRKMRLIHRRTERTCRGRTRRRVPRP